MDELYVLARRVLLDALDALGRHRDALVLVGAQAIYLRVGEADIAVAPFTTDGDLVIDPSKLSGDPPVERLLRDAGFLPKAQDSVGIWIARSMTGMGREAEVSVDLLVPKTISPGKGRRAARLPGHNPRAARIVGGLEGAVVDADLMQLGALDPKDVRSSQIRVAGPAALLTAKLHKIQDRRGKHRANDKDALDVLRLLRGTSTEDLSRRYRRLLADSRSHDSSETALHILRQCFSSRDAVGVKMVLRAIGPLADPAEITVSCELLTADLLREIAADRDRARIRP